jgi:thymidine kinase
MDGRYSVYELNILAEDDEAFDRIRTELRAVDCLFLDEASMLSAALFEQVYCSVQK